MQDSKYKNLEQYKAETNRPDLQLGAYVITEEEDRVRYYLAGYADDKGIAFGVIYCYVGGGEYQDWLVENNEALEDNGELEYSDVQALVEGRAYKGAIDEVDRYIMGIIECEDPHVWTYKLEGEPGAHAFGREIKPISYGNTYWENTLPFGESKVICF